MLKIALWCSVVWITHNLSIFLVVLELFCFLILRINFCHFMDLYILSDLLRGDVGLHGKAMSSSSRYCGCPNVYSFQQYMDITIAAIFSNIWYFQCFKYLAIFAGMQQYLCFGLCLCDGYWCRAPFYNFIDDLDILFCKVTAQVSSLPCLSFTNEILKKSELSELYTHFMRPLPDVSPSVACLFALLIMSWGIEVFNFIEVQFKSTLHM